MANLCLPYAGGGQYITYMCLYPRLIRNPKYLPNKKNGGYAPIPSDKRLRWVAIGCGECIECKKKKAREWRVRLLEEFAENNQCSFVTLTFNEKQLLKYRELAERELDNPGRKYCNIYETDNIAAKIAIRHMLERHRKKTGKSIRHWFITERGHKNTRRLHIHGIIWAKFEQTGRGKNGKNDLTEIWKNGWTYNGTYVGQQTISYVSKYITKNDSENPHFNGKICASPGIGHRYITHGAIRNKYNGKKTCETYKLPNGKEIGLPMYYRNHIYSEREREKLWINLLDKNTRYVLGAEIKMKWNGEQRYETLVEQARIISKQAGYSEPLFMNKEYHREYKDRCFEISNKSCNFATKFKNIKGYGNKNQIWQGKEHLAETTTIQNVDRENRLTGNYRSLQKPNGTAWSGLCNGGIQRPENEIYGAHTGVEAVGIETTINNRINIYETDYRMEGSKGYSIIDIETGEIYTKIEYNRIKNQLKTISYDKNKRKGVRTDGSRYTWYETKRYVQKVGADQLELFDTAS